jgi:hypothetical protein
VETPESPPLEADPGLIPAAGDFAEANSMGASPDISQGSRETVAGPEEGEAEVEPAPVSFGVQPSEVGSEGNSDVAGREKAADAVSPEPSLSTPQAPIEEEPGHEAKEQSPVATLRERLSSYADWASNKSGAQRILLGDSQGYCLYDGANTEPQVLASAVILSKSWQRCLRHLKLKDPGPVTVGLGHGYRMIIIPCDSNYGLLTLSLISNESYDDSLTGELRERLREVMGAGC